MKKFFTFCLVIFLNLGFVVTLVQAQTKPAGGSKAATNGHVMVKPSEIQWMAGPVSLPEGARVAIIEGDPAKPGPFTMRLILPPNYIIMPHYHPGIEHVTVLEGEFYMGHGNTYDQTKGSMLAAGGFAVMPAKFNHFAFTKNKQAVLQLHGIGPWEIVYLDQANDPRKKKATPNKSNPK